MQNKKSPLVPILIVLIILALLALAGIIVFYLTASSYDIDRNIIPTKNTEVTPSETVTVQYVAQWPDGFPTDHELYQTYSSQPTTGALPISERHVGYIYWHWCRGDYKTGPINRSTSLVRHGSHDTFHAYFSTESPDISGGFIYDEYGEKVVVNPTPDGTYHHPHFCCQDTYWFYVLDVKEQTFVVEE